jgi:hypothetical protein
MIEAMKMTYGLSVRALVGELAISYATLMRWKRRLAQGRAPVEKPGPKKVRPLDLAELTKRIRELEHSRRRSHGTCRLKGAFAGAISRRELDRMIAAVRRETNRKRSAQTCRVSWLRPNLAWAMDDCQCTGTADRGRLYLHNLSDLCSRYKFRPLASTELACGEEVAGHLDHLFTRFGPPLFCKRDNGGNLNHAAVDDVLAESLVVPINSPANTAPYNGAIEHTQGEFKRYLGRHRWKAESPSGFAVLAETAAHDLNHRPRRSLGNRNACRVYFGDQRLRYPKRQRQDAYRWIRDLAIAISQGAGKERIMPAAWREAAKQWLLKNRMIRIRKAGKVLPDFSLDLCHN